MSSETQDIDLSQYECPFRLVVKIEGIGERQVPMRSINMLAGVMAVYTILTHTNVFAEDVCAPGATFTTGEARKRAVLTDVNEDVSKITVRIVDAPVGAL